MWVTRNFSTVKYLSTTGGQWNRLNHGWSKLVLSEEWLDLDTIKALLLYFGGCELNLDMEIKLFTLLRFTLQWFTFIDLLYLQYSSPGNKVLYSWSRLAANAGPESGPALGLQLPWGDLGVKDRTQLRCPPPAAPFGALSYRKHQYCHTPPLPTQVSAHSSSHSWKTRPVFVISVCARLNLSSQCAMGHSVLPG